MSSRGKVWRRSGSGDLLEVYAPLDQQAEWREANLILTAVAEAMSRQLRSSEEWSRYQELCRAGASRPDRLFISFGIWQEGARRWVTADFVQNQELDSVVELDETLWRKLSERGPRDSTPVVGGHLWDFGVAWLPAFTNEMWAGNAVVSASHVAGQISNPAVLEDLVRLHDALLGDPARRRREADALPRGMNIWLYSETEDTGVPAPRELPGLLGLKFALAAAGSGGNSVASQSGENEAEAMKLLPQFLKDRLAEQKKAREAGQAVPAALGRTMAGRTAVAERAPAPPVVAEGREMPAPPRPVSRPLFADRGLAGADAPVALAVRPVADPEIASVPEVPIRPMRAEAPVKQTGGFVKTETDLRDFLAEKTEVLPDAEARAGRVRPGIWAGVAVVVVLALAGAMLWLRPWETKGAAPPAAAAPASSPGAPGTTVAGTETAAPAPTADVAKAEAGVAAENKTAAERKGAKAGTRIPDPAAAAATPAAATAGGTKGTAAKFEIEPKVDPAAEAARRKAAINALTGQQ